MGDFVTSVDVAVEKRLSRALLAEFPEHGFLGEESPPTRLDADFVWVVDPIDGTSNFAQGLPQCGVSVACLHHGEPVAAAVHCFPEDALYSARRGGGLHRNRTRLRTPDVVLDDATLLGVQWFRGAFEPEWLGPLFGSGARIRVLGSTVVQICDVAAGRLHGNVQSQGMPWDIAAVGLLAEEAGCRFTDWSGGRVFPLTDLASPQHHPSITAPPAVHRALVRLLR